MCKSSKLAGHFRVIRGFHTVRIVVIYVACTGLVIGASLYAFVEFGQKITVPISRVYLHCIYFQAKIETKRFELLESLIDMF